MPIWAMFVAQSILEHQLSEGGLKEDRRVVDGRAVPSLRVGCVIGQDAEEVGVVLRKAIGRLRDVGLRPHEVAQPFRRLVTLGVLLDGERGEVRLATRRRWKLYCGLHGLFRRGVASGRDLQKILGHLCCAFLLRRGLLSCLSSCFAFAVPNGGKRLPLWGSVQRGLSMDAGLLPFATRRSELLSRHTCSPRTPACPGSLLASGMLARCRRGRWGARWSIGACASGRISSTGGVPS